MFNVELENIGRILISVLGEPRREFDADGWNEFNCPECSSLEGVKSDGKYNCCLNISEGYFHCWRCNYSGKISRILKDYGGTNAANEYYDEIRNIRDSKEYQFVQGNALVKNELVDDENFLKLPNNFRLISSADRESYPAYKYLKWRGLDYDIINEYGIGYVPWSDDYSMRCRIVVPSYDQYRNLNYYVTRDYTGKQKLKYINPKVDKKQVIFNEQKVNWGENITLCEGVFDSFVIPNSIPLLGKVIDDDFAVYQAILEKSRANINVLLDDDAIDDGKKMYIFLNNGRLKDRVRFIQCPEGYDASLLYQKFGKNGIYKLMRSARILNEYELL